MKKSIFTISILLFSKILVGQTILEDQFQFNHLALNPALTGAKDVFSLNAGMGSQFNGTIRPQPIYQIFSTDGVLGNGGKHGIGLQAFNSNAAGFNNSGVKASYAYKYRLGELATISAGVNGGMVYQPIISNSGGVGQLLTYAGWGALMTTERFFLSVSKPVAFMKDDGFYGIKKPFYGMVGFSLGDYFNSMFNFSALFENNKSSAGNVYLTGKYWFGRKLGIGASYRSQIINGGRENKIIPMLEYQFSTPFRLGLSYDPKPYRAFQQSNSTYQQRGVLLLFVRYEFIRDDTDEREVYRMKYY